MSFTQLKKIKEIDNTPAQAIASYGSFVDLVNTTRERVKRYPRLNKGWSNDRELLCRANQTVPVFHQALRDKFGRDVMYNAIDLHPFT